MACRCSKWRERRGELRPQLLADALDRHFAQREPQRRVRVAPGAGGREEVAALAGVSADYLRRVEQGSVIPSGTTLDALAEGLRLKRLAAVPSPA